jgi:hypothetical protein
MISTYKIYEDLRQTLDERAAQQIARHLGAVYEDIQQTATKSDLAELRGVVHELAEAQKGSEGRLGRLEQVVRELAEAQKRTETRVEELAAAQKRTEQRLGILTERVDSLADAQKRTEERLSILTDRVDSLAQAQKRTETRVEELAEAQKRTETRVEELAEAQKRTEERLGVLTDRVDSLAQAQKRTELQLVALAKSQQEGFRLFGLRMDALFSRSGSRAEAAFREGIREIVREAGYTVEAYQGQDPEGYINHDPGRSYELDVLVRNGTVIVVEVKSSVGSTDVVVFARTVSLFEQQTKRQVSKKVLIAASIRDEARRRAPQLGVALGIDPSVLDA